MLPALAGAIALWRRSRHALPLYVLSLVGVVIQFGFVFAGTGLLAHKGAAATVPFRPVASPLWRSTLSPTRALTGLAPGA